MTLTYDKILALAPDPGTAQRAKPIAHRQRWHSLEGHERAIWGTLGNPADPFRTQVDFQGTAFSCSCPVRRMPCKHSIGLLLLFSKNNDAFKVVSDPPEWVSSWLQKRDERAAKKSGPPPPKRSPEEEAALAEKRKLAREKRLFQMAAGLAELESWLTDLFRQGLATLEGRSQEYWQDIAARMVDAKLGGIARRIRQLPLLMGGEDWHEKLLAELGDIYLLLKGFQNMEQLPEPLQDDLLGLSGMNFKKADVLEGPILQDYWLVAGQTESVEEGNLTARRTWLVGEQSRKNVLLLDFAWGGAGYETSYKLGTVLQGEVAFYPSAYPQRVLFKNFAYVARAFDLHNGYERLSSFAEGYAKALGANPWLHLFPAFLKEVIPVFFKKASSLQNDTFVLVDQQRKQLPLRADEDLGWKMVAMSGGRPMSVFGIFDGKKLQPLSAVVNGQFRPLHLPEAPKLERF